MSDLKGVCGECYHSAPTRVPNDIYCCHSSQRSNWNGDNDSIVDKGGRCEHFMPRDPAKNTCMSCYHYVFGGLKDSACGQIAGDTEVTIRTQGCGRFMLNRHKAAIEKCPSASTISSSRSRCPTCNGIGTVHYGEDEVACKDCEDGTKP